MTAAGLERPRVLDATCGGVGNSSVLLAAGLCVVAMLIGLVIRWTWISWANDIGPFIHDGTAQPTTQDSFFHGSVILKHADGQLVGTSHVPALLNHHGLVHLLGIGARMVLPVSTATIVLWAPVILGGVLAIPVVLLGRALGSVWWGFGGAVLAVLAVNFYERSMAGYYDHDMLSIAAATFIAWLLVESGTRRSTGWLLAAAMLVFFYPFIYAKGIAIGASIAGCWLVFSVVTAPRSASTWRTCLVIGLAAAASPLANGARIAEMPWAAPLALAMIIGLWWWLRTHAPTRGLVLACVLLGLAAGAVLFPWSLIGYQLQSYAKIGSVGTLAEGRFADVSFRYPHKATILEAQRIPAAELGFRLIGSPITAVLAMIGFVLACIRLPRLLVLLPMVAIGLFATIGGLRFITWGTVPAALGAAWLAMLVPWMVMAGVSSLGRRRVCAVGIGLALVAVAAWPNARHDMDFKVGPVFLAQDVEALEAIGTNSDPGDLVLAWWDYGTGIWYYADRDVLVHPAGVSDDLFAISRILTSDSQVEAASWAQALAAERDAGIRPAIHGVLDRAADGSDIDVPAVVERMRSGNWPGYSGEGDVFLFMPLQEMGILGPIASFSDSSAVRGGAAAPFASFLLRGIRTRNDNWLTQDSGLAFNSASGRTGMLRADGRVMAMRFASTTVVDVLPSGRTRVESHGAGDAGPFAARGRGGRLELVDTRPAEGTRLHLVVLPQPGAFIVADDRAMASNAMQMGVLGKYDSARFALVFVGPAVRVYRVQSGSVEREVPAP